MAESSILDSFGRYHHHLHLLITMLSLASPE